MKLVSILAFLGAAMAWKDIGDLIPVCRKPDGCGDFFDNLADWVVVPREQLVHHLAHGWQFRNVSDKHAAERFMSLVSDEHDVEHPALVAHEKERHAVVWRLERTVDWPSDNAAVACARWTSTMEHSPACEGGGQVRPLCGA
ncbi:hypothetical protein OPT61_g6815 [Boeremia exigua]|uniref:Uncharacterized protein n=1 Tax=Boeremia exigua TaxID=749465 RepID=A0ACC2I4P7_9PLEO|nr:hypothetical protein OPT61_g6815 [Boeremia exigua]